MDTQSSTDRQITIAAAVVVILSLYALFARWGGFMFVPLLNGLAALVILYLPAISPNTKAPGSKGSLLMVSGVLAAVFWLLAVLYWLGYILDNIASIDTLLFLIGFAASLWLGWLAWSVFQAEGGKFQFGTAESTAAPAAPADTAAPPPPAEPAAAAPPPPAEPPAAAPPPVATDDPGSDEDRRSDA